MQQEETIQNIKSRVVETLSTYFVEDAQEIIGEIGNLKRELQATGNQNGVEELNIYEALMKFVAFIGLTEAEQLELFRSYFVKAMRLGLDIKNRFEIKIGTTPDVSWPETAQLFVEALMKNDEKIGTQLIIVHGEKEGSAPTLSNWLRDYNRVYGVDKHEKIILHRYIAENQNVKKLNKEDQILLLKILEFYEGLKFPSQSQIQSMVDKTIEEYLQNNDKALEEVNTSGEERVLENLKEEITNKEGYIKDGLKKLMEKYPRVTDQVITKDPIKLLFNSDWARPTVENWLADYRAYVGVGNHEINERSDYLLRSPNVQKLSVTEREKLGLLLRSYDENYPLPFSVSEQVILFDRILEK